MGSKSTIPTDCRRPKLSQADIDVKWYAERGNLKRRRENPTVIIIFSLSDSLATCIELDTPRPSEIGSDYGKLPSKELLLKQTESAFRVPVSGTWGLGNGELFWGVWGLG